MKDHTTYSDVRKTHFDLLQRAVSKIGRKIFQEDDYRARKRGWQVIIRHGGLSRNYRDPRFDYFAACMACNGRGSHPPGTACSDCDGTDRIVLDPVAVSRPGRGPQ